MGDQERLATYVEVWWSAVGDLLALLEQASEDRWDRPTDLPGWDVRAVVAHVAHLERVLATGVEEEADPDPRGGVGDGAHLRGPMNHYCEIGVRNRRDHDPAALVAEIRAATTTRHDALLADPPTDASEAPPVTFGGMPWSWETLLRNRPLDVWMHEQDVRRALDRPGNTDSPAAAHTVDVLLAGQGFVLAKRLGAPPGTTVRWEVAGHEPVAFTVSPEGRRQPLPGGSGDPGDPASLTLRCDRATFAVLAGGRRTGSDLPDGAVEVAGDTALGARYLADMATTP